MTVCNKHCSLYIYFSLCMQLYDICDYSKKFTAFTLIVVLQIVDRCILFALVVVHLISS